jgi:hypothetical protein
MRPSIALVILFGLTSAHGGAVEDGGAVEYGGAVEDDSALLQIEPYNPRGFRPRSYGWPTGDRHD